MYPLDARSAMNRNRFFAAVHRQLAPGAPGVEAMQAPTPMPIPDTKRPPWVGRFKPARVLTTRTLGALGGDEDLLALSAPATVPVVQSSYDPNKYAITTPPVASGGWFSDLLNSIVKPAATTYAQVKTTAMIQQEQQRALAQTWNPALTGPAIQAQGWQAAYTQGTGAMPLGLSGTTLAVLAGGGLLLWAVMKK